ncbi:MULTISPECIES: hypothetical protein [Exiguobacterium]|uniref:Uncharacterized protein n=1 Tax=Exiguobacterium aurantiacum TaxID=33987 RepID=A0A377FTZ0_9BACL|nr:hypothetical protein [Exiguobacterium aurantiacum]MCC5893241.1 hypothetical protein [Exiguobacterium sp.]STO07925.1 Uncharacterised protein [Exiguobacterium aurantiacum]
MGEYINLVEIGMFLFIGLLFMGLHIFFIVRRYLRTRYAMVGVLASSVWPALMIVLSVQNIELVPALTSERVTAEAVIAWSIALSTAFMLLIPAGVFLVRMYRLSRET